MTIDFEEHIYGFPRNGWVTISFAGDNQLRFQFDRTFRRYWIPHVLFRDSTQRYHAQGITGVGDRDAVLNYIRSFSHKSRGLKVRTIGISSGSYAALLYGQLAPVNEVIAISPLSGRETDDWPLQWHHKIGPSPDYMPDLRQFFRNGPIPKITAYVSDGDGCKFPDGTEADKYMAERIGIKDIAMVPGYAHRDLARGMRDLGLLKQILTVNDR